MGIERERKGREKREREREQTRKMKKEYNRGLSNTNELRLLTYN